MASNNSRSAHQRHLLRLVRHAGICSQADLAKRSRLHPSTVSVLVRPLKRSGILVSAGRGSSQEVGGKRPELLALNPDYTRFLSLYVHEASAELLIVDFAGNKLREDAVLLPAGTGTSAPAEDVEQTIVETARRATEKAGGVGGIGVAVSSVVAPKGEVRPSVGFRRSLPGLRERLERAFDPVTAFALENDANCLAIYACRSFDEHYEHLAAVLADPCSKTVGSGIVIGGKLYRGSNGAAGELFEPRPPVIEEAESRTCGEDFARQAVYHTLSVCTVLDPQVAVLWAREPAGGPFRTEARRLLDATNAPCEVIIHERPRAPELGAAFIAAERYETALIRGLS
ncbi:MAG: ROK family protein [Spirochaetaceae bacterium]